MHDYYSEFKIGEEVYLKTDADQDKAIITEITFRGNGNAVYNINIGSKDSLHYDFEISREKCLSV